jgi:hypothetical protein
MMMPGGFRQRQSVGRIALAQWIGSATLCGRVSEPILLTGARGNLCVKLAQRSSDYRRSIGRPSASTCTALAGAPSFQSTGSSPLRSPANWPQLVVPWAMADLDADLRPIRAEPDVR